MVMLGLGSIVGIGVFVSISIVMGVVGLLVVVVLGVVVVVVVCNGLSSVQFVVNYFVSGGIYEYGYCWFWLVLGFIVGWMFVCVKSVFVVMVVFGFVVYLVNLDM